ncbi:EamA family transporter [Salsuginibacillus kocurii]|uniref:EamA family transporter n=1 Tax=Salsuginibacillus kocurii TaxID=427078 RepID=UPI000381230F|nr:EamA family transporter [Salsuginibacillus kocurii]
MSVRLAYLLVLLGAALWGITGLFVQNLYTYGFTPWQVVGIRLSFSAVLITGLLAVWRPQLLRVRIADLPYFIGTGIVSIAFFNYFFFTVMDVANVSLAVVLLYTGPIFVAVLARFTFGEPFTMPKAFALIVMLAGCGFTVGLLPVGADSIEVLTVLFGIASGFFYALYSIFGKLVSGRYHSLTVTAYSMLFGALFLLPTSALWNQSSAFLEPGVWVNGIGLALFATALAYVLYTAGLRYVESSRAAILSIIEPVVAIAIGVLVFNDILTGWQVSGILLIFAAIVLTIYGERFLEHRINKKKNRRHAEDKA